MAKKEEGKKKQQAGGGGNGNNVAQLPSRCPVEGCGKKVERSAFCSEHFGWFKEGLINRQGQKPKDFDKKYQAWSMRQNKAA